MITHVKMKYFDPRSDQLKSPASSIKAYNVPLIGNSLSLGLGGVAFIKENLLIGVLVFNILPYATSTAGDAIRVGEVLAAFFENEQHLSTFSLFTQPLPV